MKAQPTSQTMGLEKPDSVQVTAVLAMSVPGLASSAGDSSTQGASRATTVTPMKPTAALGSGSSTSPAITPPQMAR